VNGNPEFGEKNDDDDDDCGDENDDDTNGLVFVDDDGLVSLGEDGPSSSIGFSNPQNGKQRLNLIGLIFIF